MLQVNNVYKQYANHLALDNVSISVPRGEIFGLLGPNGAGKTTLIRIINAITAPDKGEVIFDGKELKLTDSSRIGYLPEERGLYKKMKVGDQAMYLCRLKGLSKTDAQKRLKYWFEKFEIEGWWNKKVEELSKGMAQKVQFITTVLHEPELLIFDEPFSGFDPVNAEILKREILELRNNGATVIFSTHNMESVEKLCQNIALINHSKVVLEGSVRDIRSQHKKGIYNIACRTERAIDLSRYNAAEIIDSSYENRISRLSVRLNNDNPNELISNIISQGELIHFEEILPSMNDIFIDIVSPK
ncbi:MAG: ABC transporter ATP-binding protein [bacterium]